MTDKVKFLCVINGNRRLFSIAPKDLTERKLAIFSTIAKPVIVADGRPLRPEPSSGLYVHTWNFETTYDVTACKF